MASVIIRGSRKESTAIQPTYTPDPFLGGNSASVSGQELLDQGYFSSYPTHRATTNVMSSCCSLPLNCWTAVTTDSSRDATGKGQQALSVSSRRSSPNSSPSALAAS